MADINASVDNINESVDTSVNESAGVETNAENQTVVDDQQNNKPMSFDDMLKTQGFQAEFDRRVAKAINTAKSKFTDPEVAELKKQLDTYIRRESAVKAGVDQRFIKFVISEVSESGEDFDKALNAYLEANPHFKAGSAVVTQPAWGNPQTGNNADSAPRMDGVEAAFRKKNPYIKF